MPLVSQAQPAAQDTLAAPVAPHEDDVKVAGERPRTGGPAPGDTFGFDAEPLGASGADDRDEIASRGPASRRAPRSGGGAGGRNGLRIAAIAAGAVVVLGGATAGALALTGGGSDDGTQTVKPTRQLADAAAPKVDPKVLEEQRRQLALERASRETREDGGKGPSLLPKGKPLPTKTPKPGDGDGGGGTGGGPSGDPVPAGEAQRIAKGLLPGYGFSGSGQFGCLVNLWNRESGWNTHAANPSGAYGIPQALPGSKMASAGPDWQNNATTQIKWGLGYIKSRYKTPCGGWSHFQSVGWY
ncbi:lytic transglycosylase domain-containing protein [Actinomadura syzygii]|uniref:aggregation-promoting factor C-terminal-like domain-containing protein n=1 Tax=Actinomadura syzygii TaxID=1427538 RepID=UPI00319E55A6